MYADDTVLYFSWKCISEIESKLNSYLRHICDWMKLNQLTLKTKKLHFILAGSHARLSTVTLLRFSLSINVVTKFSYYPRVPRQAAHLGDSVGNLYNARGPRTVLFVLKSVLITI